MLEIFVNEGGELGEWSYLVVKVRLSGTGDAKH